MNGCHRFERWISAYWDGELDSAQSVRLHRHLSGCDACRAEYGHMERLHDSLSAAFSPTAEPLPDLPDLVMAALKKEPFRPTRRAFSLRLPSLPTLARSPRVGWAVAAVACIAAFTSGLRPWENGPADLSSTTRSVASAPPSDSPLKDAVSSDRSASTPPPVSVTAIPERRPEATRKATPPVFKPALNPSAEEKNVPAPAIAPQLPSAAPPAAVEPTVTSHPSPPALKAKSALAGILKSSRVAAKQPAAKRGKTEPTAPVEKASIVMSAPNRLETSASARLRQVAGVAETRTDEEIDWVNIPLDAPVRLDQSVRSGEGSRVALALDGGLELRMNEETEIVPIRSPQSGAPYWVIRLVRGEVFAKVPGGGNGIKVLTSGHMAVVKEGEFIVRANDLLETRLMVAKGKAALENEYGRSLGTDGTQISSRMGVAPDPALPSLELQTAFRWAYDPIATDEPVKKRPG
ncbi:MAG: zf-HC2 domain-containing protein [Armatimonadetes bacterium]|nr:zf-HC2 domain-containing protein [Armatimonadota bacterium]